VRRSIVMVALTTALLGGWALPVSAQQGVYIENNGVNSSDSAAGASNVNVSYNPGNARTNSGGGANNEDRQLAREGRNRKDRGARNAVEDTGEAAPVEPVPVADDYQAYAEEAPAEPVPAPEAAPAPFDPTTIVRLPSTGVGMSEGISLTAVFAAVAAAGSAAVSLRRRVST
jgi:hypothetical protein